MKSINFVSNRDRFHMMQRMVPEARRLNGKLPASFDNAIERILKKHRGK